MGDPRDGDRDPRVVGMGMGTPRMGTEGPQGGGDGDHRGVGMGMGMGDTKLTEMGTGTPGMGTGTTGMGTGSAG